MFRSGPAVKVAVTGFDPRTKFNSNVAHQNNLGYYNGYSFKRDQTTMNLLGGFGGLQRIAQFREYNEMEYQTECSTALDIIADESFAGDEEGHSFHVYSNNPDIQKSLESLFFDVCNIDFKGRAWVRHLVKYGDFFLYVEVADKVGVTKVQALPIEEVERHEGYDPNDPDAVRFAVLNPRGGQYFENWQVLHFRIEGNEQFMPYGTSILEPARRLWRQLVMAEDAMLIYRMVRSVDRRVFYIDVTGVAANEIPNYMEQVRQSFRTNNSMDRMSGRVDERWNPVAVDDDFFIPTRLNSQTKIEPLPGGQNTAAVEDIEYLHRRLTAALKIPRAYLGFDDSLGSKASLAQEDIRFSRTITNLQKVIIAELNYLAILHLYAQGFQGEDLKDFEITLSNPSTIAVQQKLNLLNIRFDLAGKAKETGLVDEEFIQKEILGFREDIIQKIRVGKERDVLRNKFLEALEPEDPYKNPEDGAIIDPLDPTSYQGPPKTTQQNNGSTEQQQEPSTTTTSTANNKFSPQKDSTEAPIKPNQQVGSNRASGITFNNSSRPMSLNDYRQSLLSLESVAEKAKPDNNLPIENVFGKPVVKRLRRFDEVVGRFSSATARRKSSNSVIISEDDDNDVLNIEIISEDGNDKKSNIKISDLLESVDKN